jgi:hypothetical protein
VTTFKIFGTIRFGNVVGVQQFSMTRSRGIQPSTIQFVVPVIPQVPVGRSAPLQMSDTKNAFQIPDCLLTSVDADYSNGEQYSVTLLDYRWRWSYGQVSGQYNTVRGGQIVEKTKKPPKDLAEICLKELGVKQYDVSGLPNDVFPEITWELENPAVALENLCSALGCVICPQLDGSVRIYANNVGAQLPRQEGSEFNETLKIIQAPDKITIAAEATRWEVSLEIFEPFGVERSMPNPTSISKEEMLPIDQLSYMPTGGWGNEDPLSFANVDSKRYPNATIKEQIKERERVRGLAQESVWKLWGFKFPIKLPFLPFPITHVNQLIFHTDLIGETTIDFRTANQGKQYETRRRQPFVYGQYYDRTDTGKNNVATFTHEWWKNRRVIYPGGFSLDAERGIISFSDPVYLYDSKPNASSRFVRPKLYLRVVVSAKDPDTGVYWREGLEVDTGYRNKTQPKWVKRSDLRRELVVNPEDTAKVTWDNKTELKKELELYGKLELAKLQSLKSTEATYQGFQTIELDGAIHQVTYSIDSSGMTTTQASLGFEHSYFVPSQEERKRTMFLHHLVAQQSQNLNNKADYQR